MKKPLQPYVTNSKKEIPLDSKKLTPKEQMTSQLKVQLKSEKQAKKLVDEIFSNQKFIFIESQKPKTVGDYYNKYLARNDARS